MGRHRNGVRLRAPGGLPARSAGARRAARGHLPGRNQAARIRRSGPPSRAGGLPSRRAARPRRCSLRHAVLHQPQELSGCRGRIRRCAVPLVVFSHGRGSNGLYYAWFAEFLASRGYIVAALNHYRANTWDSTIAYLANKLWQRPLDVGLTISFLLNDPFWGKSIDPGRIGVAGHSQGGFTALWIGGAKVDPDKYLAFQRGWRNNAMVPEYLRRELPLDAGPALAVQDRRVKAVFAMAPGIVQAFGMDVAGLRQLTVPAYIAVGAGDTQTPPKDNAEFAAKYIPNAELDVIPGKVDHEIFVNECNEDGKDEFPEACVDSPDVDRGKIHERVGTAAVKFFDAGLNVRRGK